MERQIGKMIGDIKKEIATVETQRQEAIEKEIFLRGYKAALNFTLALIDAIDVLDTGAEP